MTYGMPYQGSKTKIAEDIIKVLPEGQRFCDIFGGGGAMSHCAMVTGKWQQILYGEINRCVCETFDNALSGKYDYNRFCPEFINREQFKECHATDGYARVCYSFGNNGVDYLYSEQNEMIKQVMHDAICFNDFNLLNELEIDISFINEYKDIKKRRLSLLKNLGFRLEHLERLERLQKMDLNLYQNLFDGKIQIACQSYEDYIYKDGDIVYCDIPYENGDAYELNFDHNKFYEWAKTRDYPVYFSMYDNISDDSFEVVWQKDGISSFSATSNCKRIECLYYNKK